MRSLVYKSLYIPKVDFKQEQDNFKDYNEQL